MAIFRRLKKKSREEEQHYNDEINKYGLEKKDIPAMVISAMLVIFPVAAGILIVFGLLIILIFT